MTRRRTLKAGLATGLALTGAAYGAVKAEPAKGASAPLRNEDFYSGGKFLADKARVAYFAMMRRYGYPISPRLQREMFVTDFGLGDFVHAGMAGIFWYNDKPTNVFGHEIFLLPGQMIVEHAHEAAGDVRAKREAWHVRGGWICTFGEGDAPAAPCPVKLPGSQAKFITVKAWKQIKVGEVDALGRATAKHFMVAGRGGAIVTEYGTYHEGAGLRFTNPAVKF